MFDLGAMAPRGMQFDMQPKQRGGMFGNPDWQSALMAAGAAMLARTNPTAARMIMGSLQDKQQSKQQEAQYQRQRRDKRDDFVFEQDYRAQHQPPDDFTQLMQAAGIDPNSEQGRALFLQAVQNKANPFTQMRVQNPDGSETLQFMRPPVQPTAPVGKLTPLGAGGPGLGGPGGFPF